MVSCTGIEYPTTTARTIPIAKGLARRGHDVSIILPRFRTPIEETVYDGVKLFPVGVHADAGLSAYVATAIRMIARAWRLDIDLLHLSKPQPNGSVCAIVKKLIGNVPLVIDCDDLEGAGGWADNMPIKSFWESVAWSRGVTWLEKTLPLWADAVTVASRTLESRVAQFGVDRRQIFYVPNGVDLSDFSELGQRRILPVELNKDHTVLYVGSLRAEHDVDLLIRAMPHVLKERSETKLVLVGGGPFLNNLRTLAEKLCVGQSVIFAGKVSRRDVPAVLTAANIVALPLRDTEMQQSASPAKLFEYMAAGKCVVASAVGQASEIISHMKTGILVKPSDPLALAMAILQLLADRNLVLRIAANAREYALRNLSWEPRLDLIEKAYDFALAH